MRPKLVKLRTELKRLVTELDSFYADNSEELKLHKISDGSWVETSITLKHYLDYHSDAFFKVLDRQIDALPKRRKNKWQPTSTSPQGKKQKKQQST